MNSATESGQTNGVFHRSLYLAGHLDNAADGLSETLFGYDWNDRSRCNCGILARHILGTSAPRLKKLLPPIYEDGVFYPTWRSMTERFCAESGLSGNEVFQRLISAGLQPDDLIHLEELSHPAIRARMAPYRRSHEPVRASRKSDVIAYLRAWAWGIEEHHNQASEAPAVLI